MRKTINERVGLYLAKMPRSWKRLCLVRGMSERKPAATETVSRVPRYWTLFLNLHAARAIERLIGLVNGIWTTSLQPQEGYQTVSPLLSLSVCLFKRLTLFLKRKPSARKRISGSLIIFYSGSADLCLKPRQVRHAHRFSDITRADFSFLAKYAVIKHKADT